MEYRPNNWVILKINGPERIFYRVLAGWSGGYIDGDSWRMNSGITRIETDGDFYLLHGVTSSIYRCHKETECLRANCSYIYNQLKELHGDAVEIVPIDELDPEYFLNG